MFTTIFKHELDYWLRKPSFYIYIIIMSLFGLLIGASSAGIFEGVSVGNAGGANIIINSPINIPKYLGIVSTLLFFLLPSIIGVSIQRDFKSDMHSVLYSYPFTKTDYLFGKFLSSFLVVILITICAGISLYIGFRLPGTKPEMIGVFHFNAYLKTYLFFIIPNMLFFGAIVFSVVTFTRNTTTGFIAIIAFLLFQGLLSGLFSDTDTRYFASLLDPNGASALNYYTRYWTIEDKNTLSMPIGILLILNRLLWLGLAILIYTLTYIKFSFSQTAYTFKLFKSKSKRMIKENFTSIVRINLPKVDLKFNRIENLKKTWKLSNIDFKFILTNLSFIAILFVGLIILTMTVFQTGIKVGRTTIPVTFKVLELGSNAFGLFLLIVTFLYSGVLINRGETTNANHLIDTTPTPNWVFMLSKLIALIKVQFLLLTMIMVVGVLFQTIKGHFNYEFGLYFYHLYILKFIPFLIWALLAFIVHTLLRNTYLGFFLLFVISIVIPMSYKIGIEQSIFHFNSGSSPEYTDLNGYGYSIIGFFKYKLYWLLLGFVFLIVSSLFWVRGLPSSFKQRLSIAKQRLTKKNLGGIFVLLFAFCSLGGYIYYEDNVLNTYISAVDREQHHADFEKKYKKYDGRSQPRVVSVKVDFDIFPKTRDFKFSGNLKMINKTTEVIDSLFVLKSQHPTEIKFNKNVDLVYKDTLYNFDIYKLKTPLQPGDSLELDCIVKNKPNTLFKKHSSILGNGTFVNGGEFMPSFGYSQRMEIKDDKKREKYGLAKNDLKPDPSDTTALGNTYISRDSDWIDFEATVSTSEDQIAIAPGYLQKEWKKDGRRYFHYKMDSKILNFFAFNSARYEVKKDTWNGVDLEVYYHKGHDVNVGHMMDGVKASIKYNSKYFSPYQHRQVRVIEFPRTKGSFAQSFPNTIPFSEGMYFLAVNKEEDKDAVNMTYAVTVHELAHQWWAHQVIGADVKGATMLSESLSEYVALKVLEHKKGKSSMRKFLQRSLDLYLSGRSREVKRELPLMYTDGQSYVRYEKGSLVFYALSDFIGEDVLNGALKTYLEKTKFQDSPYTTSLEMMDEIRKVVPEDLKYVLKDMFETVTLYRNRMVNVTSTKLAKGKYQVDMEFNVSKYRNDEKGKVYYDLAKKDSLVFNRKDKTPIVSVPLADYIDIGIFGKEEVDGKKKETELYFKKHKISKINNKISIIVDKEPVEVGIDPYNKLIDTDSDDNRKKIQ